jgi:hypothetical protein
MKKFALLLSTLLAGAQFAHAGTVLIKSGVPNDPSPTATFTGSLTYDDASLLTLILTNTSPLANGGFITGFAFNVNGNATATYIDGDNPATTNVDEDAFDNTGSVSAAPFGTFEAGAAIGGDWLGSGKPQPGVGVGETRTFLFQIAGLAASSLKVNDFISESSLGGAKSAPMIVRFRGFDDGGSNKVPAEILELPSEGPPVGPPVVIPLPPAVWTGLATMTLVGLVMARRKVLA